jgi:hypothetical protein
LGEYETAFGRVRTKVDLNEYTVRSARKKEMEVRGWAHSGTAGAGATAAGSGGSGGGCGGPVAKREVLNQVKDPDF